MGIRDTARRRSRAPRPVKQRPIDVLGCVAGGIATLGTITLGVVAATIVGATQNWNTGDVPDDRWRTVGAIGSVALTALLFAALAVGGYVTGRIAGRRSGRHGAVLVGTILAVVGASIGTLFLSGDNADIREGIRWLGIPTNGSTWDDTLIGFGAAAPFAMLAGALLGTWLGTRWHTRPGAYPQHTATGSAGRADSTQVMDAVDWPPPGAADDAPWWEEGRVDTTSRIADLAPPPRTTVSSVPRRPSTSWPTYDGGDDLVEGDLTTEALRGGRRDDPWDDWR